MFFAMALYHSVGDLTSLFRLDRDEYLDVNLDTDMVPHLLPLLALNRNTALLDSVLAAHPDIDISTLRSKLFGSALFLLERGADVNQTGGKWHTALQATCFYSGDRDAIEMLLAAGADVNLRGGERERTALLAAAAEKKPDAVQLLLDQPGLDVLVRDDVGDTVLGYLSFFGDATSVQKLLDKHEEMLSSTEGIENCRLALSLALSF